MERRSRTTGRSCSSYTHTCEVPAVRVDVAARRQWRPTHMNRTLARYVLVAFFAALAGLTPVHATFHLMVVQEVFPRSPAAPGAQYVMLRMTSSGQNLTANTFIDVQDAAGNLLGRFG